MFSTKNGTVTMMPRHGTLLAMASFGEGSDNFQSIFEHSVPKRANASGRYSITFRSNTPHVRNEVDTVAKAPHALRLAATPEECPCYLLAWDTNALDDAVHKGVYKELRALKSSMDPDRTFCYGKWHDNNGRLVHEMSWEAGQTYSYAGKQTKPGTAFPPIIRGVVRDFVAPLFGVQPHLIWAHVVYYPAGGTSLAWHGDAEQGIDPHLIVSLTYLEPSAKEGLRLPRAFQVRPKTNIK